MLNVLGIYFFVASLSRTQLSAVLQPVRWQQYCRAVKEANTNPFALAATHKQHPRHQLSRLNGYRYCYCCCFCCRRCVSNMIDALRAIVTNSFACAYSVGNQLLLLSVGCEYVRVWSVRVWSVRVFPCNLRDFSRVFYENKRKQLKTFGQKAQKYFYCLKQLMTTWCDASVWVVFNKKYAQFATIK